MSLQNSKGKRVKGDYRFRDTIMRYWKMATLIPRDPGRATTGQIAQQLQEEGFKVDKRTVERDLAKLCDVFSYWSEQDGRTNSWFYPKEQKVLEIPRMNSECALALMLARDHLKPLIPPTTLALIAPYFSKAETVLKEAHVSALAAWRQKIKVVNPGPPLKMPSITDAVLGAVYGAVLGGKQLEVEYRGRSDTKHRPHLLHPQGLVLRDGVTYLVAAAKQYPTPVHYALHRMRSARCLLESSRKLPSFDFADYVEKEFRYPVSPNSIRLELRVASDVAVHLEERPLGEDQKTKQAGEWCDVTATVSDTDELRWWILGFGEQIVVLKPIKLRREMAARIANLSAQYAAIDNN